MASPSRIYRIYLALAADAATVRDFQQANGEKVSGTVNLLCSGDRAKPLARWGEEMHELCGVLAGTHDDSYLMEATQTFYWGSLYAAMAGTTWEQLRFEEGRRTAATCGIASPSELEASVDRLVSQGVEFARPDKVFLLWNVADHLYRTRTRAEDQWSLEQLMEADLQDMKKRTYLEPILRQISA
jgi:phosphoribosyl-ATP pyrophosphohydrolase